MAKAVTPKSSQFRVWITWETQRRNRELAEAFGCEFGEFDFSALPPLQRYLKSMQATVGLIWKVKPDVVFAQCPSVVLTFFLSLLKRILGFRFVIDAHNGATEKLLAGEGWQASLIGFAFRSADAVIVSNDGLVKALLGRAKKVFALPDRIPQIHVTADNNATLPQIVVIASFAADEPMEEILRGLSAISLPFRAAVTGRKRKAGELVNFESSKIHFTDFLQESDYDNLIGNADLLVDLTTRQDCLVCGAYEAIAVGVPVVLSDSAANRSTFPKGVVYVENTEAGIASGISNALQNLDLLRREMRELRPAFQIRWAEKYRRVEEAL